MSSADIKEFLSSKEVKSNTLSVNKRMHITFKNGCDLITFYPIFNSLLLVLLKVLNFCSYTATLYHLNDHDLK